MPTSTHTETLAAATARIQGSPDPKIVPKDAHDRTARYAARIDGHLAGLPNDDARHAFLAREKATWLNYEREFIAAVDRGQHDDQPGAPTIWDYQLTLAEISTRIGRLEKVRA